MTKAQAVTNTAHAAHARKVTKAQAVTKALPSALGWLVLSVWIILSFLMLFVVALFTRPFDRRGVIAARFYRFGGAVAGRLAPGWHFRVVGNTAKPKANTVVVANHVSHADAFLIARLPWDLKWLAKRSLFSIPFVGWGMALARDVAIRRGNAESIKDAMGECKAWLKRGLGVIIFPEGTRAKDGKLQPFKNGAFRLAIETGADILPIAVYGTDTALPKHSWHFGRSEGRLAVGTPIPTRGKTLDDIKDLSDMARAQIERLMTQMANESAAALAGARKLPLRA